MFVLSDECLTLQATELFIMYLTKLSQRHGNNEEVEYHDLAAIVQRKESMEFLHDIVPKKKQKKCTRLQRNKPRPTQKKNE